MQKQTILPCNIPVAILRGRAVDKVGASYKTTPMGPQLRYFLAAPPLILGHMKPFAVPKDNVSLRDEIIVRPCVTRAQLNAASGGT
jgi:hypothetical protein